MKHFPVTLDVFVSEQIRPKTDSRPNLCCHLKKPFVDLRRTRASPFDDLGPTLNNQLLHITPVNGCSQSTVVKQPREKTPINT